MELVTKWTDGNVSITLDMRELGKLIEEMPEKAEKIVRQVGLRAEANMKKRVPPRVDTGAMMNSIYTKTDKYDGFPGQAGGKTLTPHPEPPPFVAYVGPSVEYAIYHEFGTYKMAAHPFVTPGAVAAALDLEKLAPELFE